MEIFSVLRRFPTLTRFTPKCFAVSESLRPELTRYKCQFFEIVSSHSIQVTSYVEILANTKK
ncbi:hypothetical protein THF1D04_470002 [Vibrio owensii]|uniref:Uncharacterized protein n=1 Tax=Vibrio owensii TaxID=696485 RepID=A0AAU9Q9A1_9VIBR|nr:hypothetical protein THF1D04_470002 [Vibrio owensii]